MIRPLSWLLPVAAFAGCLARVAAQTADAPAPPDADLAGSPGIFSHAPAPLPPLPAVSTSEATRNGDVQRISDQELASAIADGLPKYSPPKPPPKPSEEKDLRDVDKPKNQIIRLPSYVVRAPKPPVFTESQILTDQGLANLAMQRYVGFDPSKMPFGLAATMSRLMFQSYADQMYRDDQRQQAISNESDTAAAFQRVGDTSESSYIKRESDDTYMRSIGDTTVGMDPHSGWGAPIPSNSNSTAAPGQQQ
jgi:hypothetical protein